MQFLKYLFWCLIAFLAAVFTFGNWTSVSLGNALPSATVIGAGFLPPTAIAPNVGNVETAANYQLNPSLYAKMTYAPLTDLRGVSEFGAIPLLMVSSAAPDAPKPLRSGAIIRATSGRPSSCGCHSERSCGNP